MKRAKGGLRALLRPLGRPCTNRFTPGRISAVFAAVLLSVPVLPHAAHALDTVTLNAPGASDTLLETLRANSLLIEAQADARTDPADLMPSARAEYGRLIGLLYEQGYYAPTIQVLIDGRDAVDMSPLTTPTRIDTIVISIDLGPEFTFGAISISPLAPGTELPADFAPGQPARSTVVRAALAAALDGWRAAGHPQVDTIGQDVIADHQGDQLDVRLRLEPGPQLRFGAVVPQGNDRTHSERIVAIAGLPEGAVHDPQALQDAAERLRETGAFASVVLRTADRANPDGTVDIEAQVDEALPRRLGFGAEYDSEAGVRLSGFWLHRNLFGGAERLRLEASVDGIGARAGGLGFTLDARYIRPASFGRDTDLEIGLRAMRLNERDYNADAVEFDTSLVRRYSNALEVGGGVALRYERATYAGLNSDFGTFGLPVSVTHDSRDSPLNATGGHYVSAEVMPYVGFGDAQNGVRLEFDGRLYDDMGTGGRIVLAGRAHAGAIYGSTLAGTPRGFLFYSGGGGTVRGLPYQSLGVAGPPASGGQGFAALSGEVRVRVNDSLTFAAFADAGQVSSGAFTGTSDWHAGGGFGVRYDTPIGPLRLDLATPIRRNASASGSSDLQLYLGIGQAF